MPLEKDPAAATTVLVVDDEKNARLLAGVTLRNHGYRVLEAEDVPHAERLIQSEPVELIVLDIMMHGETGLQLCRRLKDAGSTRDIPVLIVSGLAAGVSGKESSIRESSGADDVLLKPYALHDLIERVKRLLEPRA